MAQQEKDKLLDHEADGIREFDNNLPKWWLYGFYVTIVLSVVYMFYYHVYTGPSWNVLWFWERGSTAEYTAEVAEAKGMYANAPKKGPIKAVLLTDAASLEKGKDIFENKNLCVTCHRADMGGQVGPNLTDSLWIHGCSLEDHESYRNELASIAIDGKRKWIYARKPKGSYTRSRAIVATILLAFLAISPFVKVHGHQFMLLNIMERQFVFFGLPFWPNDFYLVALVFITIVITLVVSTAIVGRIWCGWLCPQTIFLEFIFRRIEWWIEGTPVQQAQRHHGPWNADRIWRTGLKQSIFFTISFAIANIFLAYLISSDKLLLYITEGPAQHASVLIPLVAFTFVFYAVFARFREQACLIVCPYGRYMSSLVDDNTITVTYDTKRGERRGKFSKADKDAWSAGQSRPEGKGDCVDCHQCVTVCPTGIDIRNGIQLECVACTACIDACDEVMVKVGRPKGLIRYTSATAVKQSVAKVFTTRIKAYVAVWVVLMSAVVVLFSMREMLDVLVLRQEGTTWVKTPAGVANFYRMQIINKSDDELPVEVVAVQPANAIITPIEKFDVIHGGHIAKGRFIITIPGADGMHGAMPITLSIRSKGREVKSVTTSFIGGSL